MTTTEHHVRPGQIWADNDARSEGRTVRVDKLDHRWRTAGGVYGAVQYAICTVLTPPDNYPQGRTGHSVKIQASRMRPTSTGYRLVTDVPA